MRRLTVLALFCFARLAAENAPVLPGSVPAHFGGSYQSSNDGESGSWDSKFS